MPYIQIKKSSLIDIQNALEGLADLVSDLTDGEKPPAYLDAVGLLVPLEDAIENREPGNHAIHKL